MTIDQNTTPETAHEMGRALRAGGTTALALAERSLDQAARDNGRLNAFVLINREGALAAARAADAELAAGIDRGHLHGIPIAVKDIFDMEGLPTGCGTDSDFGAECAETDADVVAALRRAGAVIVGKTTMHEFAYGATGDRSAQGASHNPREPKRMSGGSSGGSAVAVASGMVPLALGTDTAGSVRVPAALCGVVGFKPAFGALSTEGVWPLAPTLDHVGIFATTSEDARLLYAALVPGAVTDCAEPSAPEVFWVDPSALTSMDEEIADTVRAALDGSGIEVREGVAIDDLVRRDDLFDLFSTLQGREAHLVHRAHLDRDESRIDPEVVARLRVGGRITPEAYATADHERSAFRDAVNLLLGDSSVLALPTVSVTAPEIGQRVMAVSGDELEVRATLLAMTSPWNLTGSPAISIPAGVVDGLPVGLQLVAAPGREALLFDLARLIEQHDPTIPSER